MCLSRNVNLLWSVVCTSVITPCGRFSSTSSSSLRSHQLSRLIYLVICVTIRIIAAARSQARGTERHCGNLSVVLFSSHQIYISPSVLRRKRFLLQRFENQQKTLRRLSLLFKISKYFRNQRKNMDFAFSSKSR